MSYGLPTPDKTVSPFPKWPYSLCDDGQPEKGKLLATVANQLFLVIYAEDKFFPGSTGNYLMP